MTHNVDFKHTKDILTKHKKFCLRKRTKQAIDTAIVSLDISAWLYNLLVGLHTTPERLEELKEELKQAKENNAHD